MILPILKYPHPNLARACEPVEEINDAVRELAANMVETMYNAQGIGLAASQVGELIRLVVIDVSGPEERSAPMVLINPKLTLLGELMDSDEGCLSVPDYRDTVSRSSRVRCEALDLDGKPLDFEAEDILAVCLQHEIDHLDGRLFLDRLSRLKRSLHDGRLKKQARHSQGNLSSPSV
jgi:peptide deformylase